MNIPLPPGSKIGILGSGQLGRMLAQAASPLGLRPYVFCPSTGPAFDVCIDGKTANYDDKKALEDFGKSVDVITYEFENIPVETVEFLEQFCPVRPRPKALQVSQDRLIEKTFIQKTGVDVAPFEAVETAKDLEKALDRFKGNGVLKTRRFGYDGKGQIMLKADAPLSPQEAIDQLGHVPLILEELIPFSKEVSIIGIRGLDGSVVSYDAAENVHENHILKTSTVPATLPEETAREAAAIAEKILSGLDYVGAMGIEFFVVEEDEKTRLIVNEIAPRVHNSGHWTMDACFHSQFEQHIRAICGWPLGSTRRHSDVVMTNLLGDDIHQWLNHATLMNSHLHHYAKNEAREGRKMGHVNVLAPHSSKD